MPLTITITFESMSANELKGVIALLSVYTGKVEQALPSPYGPTISAETLPESYYTEKTPEPVPERAEPETEVSKKRGRKPKYATLVMPELPLEAELEAEAEPKTEAGFSADDLRNAANGYVAKHGMPGFVELLKDFGCNRISELAALPVDQQAEYMKCARA